MTCDKSEYEEIVQPKRQKGAGIVGVLRRSHQTRTESRLNFGPQNGVQKVLDFCVWFHCRSFSRRSSNSYRTNGLTYARWDSVFPCARLRPTFWQAIVENRKKKKQAQRRKKDIAAGHVQVIAIAR